MKTKSQRGFSIVEMMIALVLGLIVSGAAITLFAQSKNNYLEDDGLARMQENARYALHLLAHDIAMAGFWGGPMPGLIDDPGSTALPITIDCGASGERWAYDPNQPVQYFVPNAPDDTPNSVFGCISDNEYAPNTNVLAIKRVSGNSNLPTSSLQEGRVYLRTSAIGPTLLKAGAGETTPANAQDWAYQTHVYYITKRGIDDGIPKLYRKRLTVDSGAPTMKDESGDLVQGIEYFHVEFGIDTTGDGTADRYLSAPPTPANSAVSIRISILVRSIETIHSHVDDKDYVLGDVELCTDQSPNKPCNITLSGANHYRRVYSTTIQMRNHIYQTQTSSALDL